MSKTTFRIVSVCAIVFIIAGCRRHPVIPPNGPTASGVVPPIIADAPLPAKTQNAAEEVRVGFGSYDHAFRFAGFIPSEYQVEYVPEIRSINIYDPKASGDTAREQSQIFIRFFEANTFLTLSTVDILKREDTTLKGHAAVRYEIKKKPGVPPFPQQPRWRNEQHSLIDIRSSEENPTAFYVFAYNPALPEEVFNRFMSSIVFDTDVESP